MNSACQPFARYALITRLFILHTEVRLGEAFNTQAAEFQNEGAIQKIRFAQQCKMAEAFADFIGTDTATIVDIHLDPSSFPDGPVHTLNTLWPERRSTVVPCAITLRAGEGWEAEPAERSAGTRGTLPFQDGQFDWAFCNATLEHIGTPAQQQALLREMWRVSKKGIFVTAPNKDHPLEFNTGLPLLHLLPQPVWANALKWFGKAAKLPSLFTAALLQKHARLLPDATSCDIGHVRMMGIKAQFFLMMKKKDIS